MNMLWAFCAFVAVSQQCASGTCEAFDSEVAFKEALFTKLDMLVESHPLLEHNYLMRFSKAEFVDMKLAIQDFATEHYVYSRTFQVYLKNVLEKIKDSGSIELIGANINEERGNYDEDDLVFMEKHGVPREWYQGVPHPQLMKRFVQSANGDVTFEKGLAKEFTDLMISTTKESEVCVGLAILAFAIESSVSRLYQFIWDGLKKANVLDDSQFVFFPLHILIDDGHADALKDAWYTAFKENPATCFQKSYDVTKLILDARVKWYDSLDMKYKSKKKEVTQASEIEEAKKKTLQMKDPGYTLKQKLALTSRILAWQGQGNTLSGQISCRDHLEDGTLALWVQKYGPGIEELTPQSFIHVDEHLKPIDDDVEDFPNYATRFHVHVYRKRPDIKCLVHSHPIHVSALAMTGMKLDPQHMDFMAFYEDIQFLDEWPGVPFGDMEGEIISGLLGEKYWSGLLANHGLIVGGKNIEEATYRAYFMERAARAQLLALSASPTLKEVNPKLGNEARDWRMSEGPVMAHYRFWCRMVLRDEKTYNQIFKDEDMYSRF